MINANPRVYSQAIWDLVHEAAATDRLAVLTRVAEDLVQRFRRPFRTRVLMALEKLEQEASPAKPLKIIAASESIATQLQAQFSNVPLELEIDPRLKAGAVFEQGERRIDASLRKRLRILKTALTQA